MPLQVDFFSKRYGLRSLVAQTCWDLLYNTHALRKDHLEVEVFARFLEEFYDPDDLLFFLYVRNVIQKVRPPPLTLTQCSHSAALIPHSAPDPRPRTPAGDWHQLSQPMDRAGSRAGAG